MRDGEEVVEVDDHRVDVRVIRSTQLERHLKHTEREERHPTGAINLTTFSNSKGEIKEKVVGFVLKIEIIL